MILYSILFFFALRLFFLKLSKTNEQRILQDGGTEYGVKTTKCLTIVHIIYYLACVTEAIYSQTTFDSLSTIGLIMMIFSMIMLYIVTRLLKGIWTIKLMIVKNHQFNDHWLFRNIKHPNYYLNIGPELIGVALLCHATYSAIILLPIYAWILYLRIKEENYLIQHIILPNTEKIQ